MEEREAKAERNFKAIADKVRARKRLAYQKRIQQSGDAIFTSIEAIEEPNFIVENIKVLNNVSMSTLERTKKAREHQLEVKKRREEQTIATENFRLIWLQKQNLLKHIRAEMVSKKQEELRI